ncbi:hypothetical protein R1flu_002584 [Riccia fluitans]|uniref:Uncharacterized protein n=1 Tax=Riccia fluitans TaxID=41844 RepID=A0ABD1Y6J6_9MARC
MERFFDHDSDIMLSWTVDIYKRPRLAIWDLSLKTRSKDKDKSSRNPEHGIVFNAVQNSTQHLEVFTKNNKDKKLFKIILLMKRYEKSLVETKPGQATSRRKEPMFPQTKDLTFKKYGKGKDPVAAKMLENWKKRKPIFGDEGGKYQPTYEGADADTAGELLRALVSKALMPIVLQNCL